MIAAKDVSNFVNWKVFMKDFAMIAAKDVSKFVNLRMFMKDSRSQCLPQG